jgi:hypothetical protein
MNDTHGETGKGWYGFDLDGTLAKYDGWKGIDHIGEPVKLMVDLMKRMHDEGKVVKIMTARVAPRRLEDGTVGEQFTWLTREPSSDPSAKYTATQYIQDWCEEVAQLGFVPEIVYQKDHLMLELYDDRVKQVVPNEGWLVEDIAKSKRQCTEIMITKTKFVNCKWYDRLGGFLIGMAVISIIIIAIQMYFAATMTVPEAERKLHDAAHDYMQSKLNERVEGLLK